MYKSGLLVQANMKCQFRNKKRVPFITVFNALHIKYNLTAAKSILDTNLLCKVEFCLDRVVTKMAVQKEQECTVYLKFMETLIQT